MVQHVLAYLGPYISLVLWLFWKKGNHFFKFSPYFLNIMETYGVFILFLSCNLESKVRAVKEFAQPTNHSAQDYALANNIKIHTVYCT